MFCAGKFMPLLFWTTRAIDDTCAHARAPLHSHTIVTSLQLRLRSMKPILDIAAWPLGRLTAQCCAEGSASSLSRLSFPLPVSPLSSSSPQPQILVFYHMRPGLTVPLPGAEQVRAIIVSDESVREARMELSDDAATDDSSMASGGQVLIGSSLGQKQGLKRPGIRMLPKTRCKLERMYKYNSWFNAANKFDGGVSASVGAK
jgi:hypothetical protein